MANGLKLFALGMNEEVSALGRMALGTDFSSPTGVAAQQPSPPVGMQQPMPMPATPPIPNARQPVPNATPSSGGGAGMSIPAVMYERFTKHHGMAPHIAAGFLGNFQQESGFKPGAINKKEGAVGYGQHREDRRADLENFAKQRGTSPDDPNTFADFVMWELGGKESKAWKRIQQAKSPQEAAALVDQFYERSAGTERSKRQQYAANFAGGNFGTATMSSRNGSTPPFFPTDGESSLSVDVSEQEKALQEDLDPEVKKRRARGMMMMALSKGLSQLSHGEPIDLEEVLKAHVERQNDIRQRLMEIASEKRRQQEREQGRTWQLEDQTTAEASRVAADTRQEEADIRAEDRATAKSERENEALSTSLGALYPDSPWLKDVQAVTKLNPTVGIAYAQQKAAEDKAAREKAETEQQNETIAQVYDGYGFGDIATMARNGDLIGARDIYKERTGTTDAQLDAAVLQRGGPEALALAQRLRLESGATDPQASGAIDLEKNYLTEEGKLILANREKQGQLEAMSAALANPNLDTGAFQAAILPFRQYLRDFGIGDSDQVDQQTVVNAIGNNLVSYMRKPGEGVVSDADAKRFAAAAPGLGKSPIANKVLTYVHLNTIKRQEVAHNARMEYFAKGGDLGDTKARDAFVANRVKEQFGEGPMIAEPKTPQDAVHVPQGQPYVYNGKFYVNGANGPEG